MGIYELMLTSEEVRRLAHDNASTWEIKKAAVHSGMVTLRMDGWKKVVAGQTSVDEVMRVTKGDREVVMIPTADGLQLKDDAGLIV